MAGLLLGVLAGTHFALTAAIAGATMLELTPKQRVLLAETLRDIANIAAGAIVFGQFLGERPFSPAIALLGFVMWAVLVTSAMSLIGRKYS